MADRYWVGGSATWDGTAGTKWALTSGGAGGQAVPTAADDVYIDSGSGAVTVTVGTGALCRNLSFVSGAGVFAGTFAGTTAFTISGGMTVSSAMTISFSGGITFNATVAGNTIASAGKTIDNTITFNGAGGEWQLQDNLTLGSGRSIVLTAGTIDLAGKTLACHTLSSSNTNTRAIKFGAGQITVRANSANVVNMANATGFTYTGTPTIVSNYSGATGTRTYLFGTTAGGSETNAPDFYVSAGTDIVLVAVHVGKLNFTGFSGSFNSQSRTIYGDLTLSATMTWGAGTDTTTFGGTSGTSTITTNGITLDAVVVFSAVGKTWTLGSDLTVNPARIFRLINGTLDAGTKNVSIGTFSLNVGTKTLSLGSGTWTVSGTSWDAATNGSNFTVSASTATIKMTSASSKTFAGNGKSWPVLDQAGSGALVITGNNSFSNITSTYTATGAATISFTAGTTQTVGQFTASGTSGKLLTLNSATPGSTFTLSDASGYNSVSYCDIKDSIATGGAGWIAYTTNGNVNSGNNSGWDFTVPDVVAYSSPIEFRSFTKRRELY